MFRRHGPGHVEGVVEAIPLQDGSASIVWSIATVHHWGDIDGGLREARRVLLPPRVVVSPSNGKRNLGQVVMPAMDGARTKPRLHGPMSSAWLCRRPRRTNDYRAPIDGQRCGQRGLIPSDTDEE